MTNFAVITGPELATILLAFGGLLAGFYGFANKQIKEAREERRDDRDAFMKTIEKLGASIDKNTKTSDQLNEFLVRLNGSLTRTVKEKQDKAKE
jgi:gas vesicle protein